MPGASHDFLVFGRFANLHALPDPVGGHHRTSAYAVEGGRLVAAGVVRLLHHGDRADPERISGPRGPEPAF
jgi:hypothetical protein